MNYTYPELVDNPSNETLVANITAQYDDAMSFDGSDKKKRQDDNTDPAKGIVYLAEVKLPVYGFRDGKGNSQPYEVFIYLGDLPTDGSNDFVGMTSTVGGKKMDNDQAATITIDLTLALERVGKKSDDAAADWLLDNLHWRVGLGDYEIDKKDIKGLEVNLISTEVEFSGRNDVFDRWVGGYDYHGKVDA
jgi:tyrosinase